MLNRTNIRSAQVRFRAALKSRHAATGLRSGDDIARAIERRTGVPSAAITADHWRTIPSGGRFLPVRSEGERFTANLCDE